MRFSLSLSLFLRLLFVWFPLDPSYHLARVFALNLSLSLISLLAISERLGFYSFIYFYLFHQIYIHVYSKLMKFGRFNCVCLFLFHEILVRDYRSCFRYRWDLLEYHARLILFCIFIDADDPVNDSIPSRPFTCLAAPQVWKLRRLDETYSSKSSC